MDYKNGTHQPETGFTLVELLVVITIIAVLLALLTPALDKAVYQSELAVCASRLKAITTSLTGYASENKRAYPYRPALAQKWMRPHMLANASDAAQNTAVLGNATVNGAVGGRFDDRPNLRKALGPSLKLLLDPLCGKVDLDYTTDVTDTFGNYMLWCGMKYATVRGGTGLFKLGDRFEWQDDSRGPAGKTSFSLLASDEDTAYLAGSSSFYQQLANHPDQNNFLFFEKLQRADLVFSRWAQIVPTPLRGPLDTNFAYTDGSVERYPDVKWADERMARVPYESNANSWSAGQTIYVQIPKR